MVSSHFLDDSCFATFELPFDEWKKTMDAVSAIAFLRNSIDNILKKNKFCKMWAENNPTASMVVAGGALTRAKFGMSLHEKRGDIDVFMPGGPLYDAVLNNIKQQKNCFHEHPSIPAANVMTAMLCLKRVGMPHELSNLVMNCLNVSWGNQISPYLCGHSNFKGYTRSKCVMLNNQIIQFIPTDGQYPEDIIKDFDLPYVMAYHSVWPSRRTVISQSCYIAWKTKHCCGYPLNAKRRQKALSKGFTVPDQPWLLDRVMKVTGSIGNAKIVWINLDQWKTAPYDLFRSEKHFIMFVTPNIKVQTRPLFIKLEPSLKQTLDELADLSGLDMIQNKFKKNSYLSVGNSPRIMIINSNYDWSDYVNFFMFDETHLHTVLNMIDNTCCFPL